jgi:hypothetical protein
MYTKPYFDEVISVSNIAIVARSGGVATGCSTKILLRDVKVQIAKVDDVNGALSERDGLPQRASNPFKASSAVLTF